jgi:CRP-like cAMP-binding protein
MSKIIALLAQVQLFRNLSNEKLEELSRHFTLIKKEKGELLYSAGDQPECIHFLIVGQIMAATYFPDGKRLINLFYQPGSFFAESSLEDKPLPFFLETRDYSTMLRIRTSDFWYILETNPDLNRRFIQQLASKNLEQNEQLTLLSIPDTKERVKKFLAMIVRLNPLHMPVNLTHQEISDACCLTRETVTRTITLLTKAGQIKKDGRRLIPCFS